MNRWLSNFFESKSEAFYDADIKSLLENWRRAVQPDGNCIASYGSLEIRNKILCFMLNGENHFSQPS